MTPIDVGVDLGGTKMLIIARDADGALVTETRVPTGPEISPEDIEAAIHAFVDDRPVRTAAVAVPGLVAPDGSVVESDVLPRLRDWRPKIAGRLPFVVNDVRASLAYATDVAAATDVLCVVAGTAIAAAFTNSATTEPFRGGAGFAGELGYLPMQRRDGTWTTLDEVAGGGALLQRLSLTPAEVHRDKADHRVVAEVQAAGAALGRGIACCVNLLNPTTLFVGGGTCRYPGYLDAALEAARTATLPQSWAAVQVRTFPDPDRFVADGALLAARAS